MKKQLIICLLLVVVGVGVFFAGGCSPLPVLPQGQPCLEGDDCRPGQYCSSGMCRSATCLDDNDCGSTGSYKCVAGTCIGGGGEKTVVLTEPPEGIIDGGADGPVVDAPLVDGGGSDTVPEVQAEGGGDSAPDVVPEDGGDRDLSPDQTPDVVPETPPEQTCIPGSTQVCYGGPESTRGIGTCRAGVKTCRSGKWGACEGEVLPTAETCDSKDNDCDGQIDESLTRGCYSGPAGTAGKGVCKVGTQTCTAGQWGACVGEVTPKPEACGPNSVANGVDEDCDGQKDEGCLECNTGELRLCTSTQYPVDSPCYRGNQRCDNGKWGGCRTPSPDAAETCGNNRDDDCNGKVDDGCP